MRIPLTLVLLMLPGLLARAQPIPAGDPIEDYARLLQLEGAIPAFSFSVRPLQAEEVLTPPATDISHPWQRALARYGLPSAEAENGLSMLDAQLQTFWNSARPAGVNDGAVWQGRGGTVALSAGAFGRYGSLTAALRPLVFYSRNRDFELSPLPVRAGRSPYAYPHPTKNIDMPQRFGPDPFATIDLGPSYIRLDYRSLAGGLSNENMWWGPGAQHAIILTNNAPGFPHGFLSTSRPLDVKVGNLRGKWIWGRLTESAYLNDFPDDDHRFITGAILEIEPRWVRGLYLGVAQMNVLRLDTRDLGLRDFFSVVNLPFYDAGFREGQRTGGDDKMLAVMARWLLPESGFELYGEWARGDHTSSFRDAFVQPEHGRAYGLGLQKSFTPAFRRRIRLTMELIHLESPREESSRKNNSYFYVHTAVVQGYTQRGQVLGAGIGPGSNSQYIGLDLFAPWGRSGLFVRRVVYDNDRYYVLRTNNRDHETEYSGGLQGLLFYRRLELQGALTVGRLLNRHYVYLDDQTNVNVTFSVRRSFSRYR